MESNHNKQNSVPKILDKEQKLVSREEYPKISLIGIFHSKTENGYEPPKNNYMKIKDFLESNRPKFITLEVPLYRYEVRMWYQHLFSKSIKDLDQDEIRSLEKPIYADEFVAAIIYCRRNNTPLYFIDLWKNTVEETANTNLINDPGAIIDKTRARFVPSKELDKIKNFDNRNKFMAQVIDKISQKYPGEKGVHIGGIDHLKTKYSPNPLQSSIHKMNTKVIDLSE